MFKNIKNKNVQLRLRKVFKSLVACTLVISIMACSSLNAFAAGKKEYISEIKFATDDVCSKAEAKKYLIENGYEIAADEYDIGFNDALYVGYKTTRNPKNAITDIAVMNMNGGYSFSEYEKLVKEQKQVMDGIVDIIMHGVYEYRANYSLGSPAAKYARDMMNAYKEDDSGMLMGDLLLDTSISEDKLSTIFMQASGAYLSVIKTNLGLACAPFGKDNNGNDKVTWMERLSKLGVDGVMKAGQDDSQNVRAITLKKVLSEIAPELNQYLKVQEIIDSTVGTGDLTREQKKQALKIIDENYTPETKVNFSQSATTYGVLKSFPYEDLYQPEIKTLADLVLKSQELDSYTFHAMASVLTEAEYQMMNIVGASTLINTVGNTEENWKKIRKEVAGMNFKKAPIASIYDGVDREMFNGKVAMTSESIRANNMNSDNNILYGNINEIAEIAMLTIMSTSAAIMIGAGIYAGFSKVGIFTEAIKSGYVGGGYKSISLWSDRQIAYLRNTMPEQFVTVLSTAGKIFFSAMAVLAVVMIVFAALEIANYYKNDYTTMPLIMMDSVMQKNAEGVPTEPVLIKYNAITQQTVNIQNNYIADLNTFGGNQWIIMYTTKDKLAGAPILAKNFSFAHSATYPADNVSPIHRFGEKDPYDLKSASGFSLDVYGSFERDPEALKTTASVFTFNFTTALALALGAAVGGLISVFSTLAIVKKKKRKESLAG